MLDVQHGKLLLYILVGQMSDCACFGSLAQVKYIRSVFNFNMEFFMHSLVHAATGKAYAILGESNQF